MRNKLILLMVLGLCLIAHSVSAQIVEWQSANQAAVGWEAITVLENGAAIPAGDRIEYQAYIKAEDGTNKLKFGAQVSAPQVALIFANEGRYFWGVSAIRITVSGVTTESGISWSDNPANMKSGVPQGFQYFMAPKMPTLLP